jgi:hypothetical protein
MTKIHDFIRWAPVGMQFGLDELRKLGVTASSANVVILNKMAAKPEHLRQIEKLQRGGPGTPARWMKVKE